MESRRVVVGVDIRSYREAIARTVRNMRPALKVYETEPEELDQEVARLQPEFVVCSHVTSAVEALVPVWVELYPDCEAHSRVSFWGEITIVADMQLTDLLALLDQPQILPVLGLDPPDPLCPKPSLTPQSSSLSRPSVPPT